MKVKLFFIGLIVLVSCSIYLTLASALNCNSKKTMPEGYILIKNQLGEFSFKDSTGFKHISIRDSECEIINDFALGMEKI